MSSKYYCIKDYYSKEYQTIIYRKGELYSKMFLGKDEIVDDHDRFSVTIYLDDDTHITE